MSPAVCTFCSHANPPGSAFCNECGAALTLVLCKACEAVNDRDATHCYKCGSALPRASGVVTAIDSPAAARELLPDTFALAATHAAVDELELGDSGARLGWPRRRLHPALVIVPLCALAAVGYYAYQRKEATAPAPPLPATREIRVQSPAGPDASQNSRAAPQPSPAANSSIAADPGVTGRALKESAPAGADAGVNDGVRQVPLQSATKDAPTPQAAASTDPTPQAEQHPRQKSRGAKRDNALALSRARPGEPAVPGTARSFDRREQGDFRPPAQCTDAVAALALCSRNNPKGQ